MVWIFGGKTVIEIGIGPVCMLIGVFVGAWLTHRAQRHESPLPALPERKPVEEPKKAYPVKP